MDLTPILTMTLQALSGVLATIITGFLVKFLKEKTGITLDENQQKQAREIVLSMEEKAIAMLKHKYTAPEGPDKRAYAIDELMKLNPKMSVEAAKMQIDRAVGSLPNVGAFKADECSQPLVVGLTNGK